jgi:hypothetical protein
MLEVPRPVRARSPTTSVEADAAPDLPLCYGDLPYRVQRALGLIPARGLGVGRRAIVVAGVAWLPLAVAAAFAGRLLPDGTGETLLQQFGITVKLLVAIPVLIVGEMMLDRLSQKKIAHFVTSGLVTEADRSAFASLVERAVAWRNAWKPLLLLALLLVTWTLLPGPLTAHDVLWAQDDTLQRFSLRFGEWWYVVVARPLFLALVLTWLWRLTVLGALLVKISRLPLSLVPSHADRAAGLGFLADLPYAFSPLSFALASVLAAQWGHAAVYHAVELRGFIVPLTSFAAAMTLVVLAPLLVFSGSLATWRRQARLDYGALMSEHGRLVRRRWVLGETLHDDSLLESRELGGASDAAAIYDGVERMRYVPFGWKTVVWVVAPIAAPMAPLITIEMDLVDALKMALSTLL